MSISVWFRGPMLFCNRKSDVEYAIVPKSEGRDRFPGDLIENQRAVRHSAGIVLNNRCGPTIEDYNVKISDGSGAVAQVDGTASGEYSRLVPLSELANGKSATVLAPVDKSDPNVSAWIEFEGGTIGTYQLSGINYTFPDSHSAPLPGAQHVPLYAIWTTQRDDITVQLDTRITGGISQTIKLTKGQNLYVFNYDEIPMDNAEYRAGPLRCDGTSAPKDYIDHDFKWLYYLLSAQGHDWVAWRGGDDLPAPHYKCAKPLTFFSPGNGDCFSARWELE